MTFPWPLIGGFLKANFTAILIAIGVAFFLWQGKSMFDDWVEREQQKEQQIATLVSERDRARIEAEVNKAVNEEKERHEERLELLLTDAIEKQDIIRTEEREQKEIFERHQFEKLTEAKPGLIEKLANKATQERFDAFEDAFNN